MRYRKLTSLVAVVGAALAVVGLAGCDSKIGTAAVVGGHKVTDSDVTRYLTAKAKPFSVQSSTGAAQTIVPRSYVLTAIIREQLFTKTLAATKGGVPSESDIANTQQQLTQGATQAQEEKQYTQYGFTASFASLDLRDSVLETILAQRVGATSDAGPLLAAIAKLHLDVSVSGRYGTWDTSQLGLKTGPSDGAPGFVSLPGASYSDVVAAPAG